MCVKHTGGLFKTPVQFLWVIVGLETLRSAMIHNDLTTRQHVNVLTNDVDLNLLVRLCDKTTTISSTLRMKCMLSRRYWRHSALYGPYTKAVFQCLMKLFTCPSFTPKSTFIISVLASFKDSSLCVSAHWPSLTDRRCCFNQCLPRVLFFASLFPQADIVSENLFLITCLIK